MKTVNTDWATIKFRDDGITHIHYANELLDLKKSVTVFNAVRKDSPWEISPILATSDTFGSQDKEAQKFLVSSEVMKHCSAIGIVSKTLGEKMLANFFIKFMKPSKPTKFFSSEQEAIAWLKGFEFIPKK